MKSLSDIMQSLPKDIVDRIENRAKEIIRLTGNMKSFTFYTNYGNRTVKATDKVAARVMVRSMLEEEAYREGKEAPVAWDIYLIEEEAKPMAKAAFVRARVDPKILEEANKVLEACGRTKSDVIRSLFKYIATTKELPYSLFIPNNKTVDAMKEGREILKSKQERRDKITRETTLSRIMRDVNIGKIDTAD